MAHLIVATPNLQIERYPGDVLGPDYHQASIARNPISIHGPLTTIGQGPGLGVEVDRDVIERHRIR